MWNMLRRIFFTMLILVFGGQYSVIAQETIVDLKREIDELKKGQVAVQTDLMMIKKYLFSNKKPSTPNVDVKDVEIDLADNPCKGDDSAPLVIVEFTDYQCSFCAKHTKEIYPEIKKKYINTGKLRYVIVDRPLPSHEMAAKAAEATHCAEEQGKFWEMHDKMMANPDKIDDLNFLVSSLDIDIQKFKNCMDKKKYAGKVISNATLAMKLNISYVPSFIFASSDPDNPNKIKGISYIVGARPFRQFQTDIDKVLTDLTK